MEGAFAGVQGYLRPAVGRGLLAADSLERDVE